MKNLLIILSALFLFIGCESQYDTYEDVAGGGKIRYVGKVSGLKIESGWERFVLSWDATNDPTVTKYMLVWSGDGERDTAFIDGSWTSFDTASDMAQVGLSDFRFTAQSYIFQLYAMDAEGRKSKESMVVATPMNSLHPSVKFLPKAEAKSYFIPASDGSVDVTLLLKPRDLKEKFAQVRYVDNSGAEKFYELTADDYAAGFVQFNMDGDEDAIFIERHIELEDCIDLVKLVGDIAQSVPKSDVAYDETLRNEVIRVYDIPNTDEEYALFCDTVKNLQIDYSINTLSDIVTYKNLNRVVLGSGRYNLRLTSADLTRNEKSKFNDNVIEVAALKMMKSKNPDFKVKIYHDHFLIGSDLMEVTDLVEGGRYTDAPVMPSGLTFWETGYTASHDDAASNLQGLYFNAQDQNYNNYDLGAKMFDYYSDLKEQTVAREYVAESNFINELNMTVTMTTSPYQFANLNGIAIRQLYREDDSDADVKHMPTKVSVMYRSGFRPTFVVRDVQLGTARGEITVINFPRQITSSEIYITFDVPDGKVVIDDVMFF